MNILFTCAGRRTYLLKYFKEQLGGDGKIIGTDMQMSAPALTVADIAVTVPAVYSNDYIERTLKICKDNDVKVLICLNDLELPILAENIEKFKTIGVTPIVSDKKIIDICFDKDKTASFIKSLGLLTPKTFSNYEEAIKAINTGELDFPLVLKPRWGSGSIGIEFVEDLEQLELAYKLVSTKVKKSILSTASSNEDFILIQEKIEGPEYGLDIINDLSGENRAVSVKKKLAMRAGETDKAITVDNSEICLIGKKIAENLKHIGNLDCDILEKEGKYYVLELNPRFGGGFPFSYEAGVNEPKAIIEWAKGNEIDDAILIPKYGKMFAKNDYLVECKS